MTELVVKSECNEVMTVICCGSERTLQENTHKESTFLFFMKGTLLFPAYKPTYKQKGDNGWGRTRTRRKRAVRWASGWRESTDK